MNILRATEYCKKLITKELLPGNGGGGDPTTPLSRSRQLVEIKVQEQHIDPRLTQKTKLSSLSVLGDQPADRIFRKVPLQGDPGYLELSRRRSNVRIEP